jgi:hypothetical protein
VCATIIEDDGHDLNAARVTHPWLSHPLASELMEAVARWIESDSSGEGTPEQIERIRRIALRIDQS